MFEQMNPQYYNKRLNSIKSQKTSLELTGSQLHLYEDNIKLNFKYKEG